MTGSVPSALVIETLAEVLTVVFAVGSLLAGAGSSVVASELGVLLRPVPSGVLGLTVAVILTVTPSPEAIVPSVSEPVQVAGALGPVPVSTVYVGLVK